MNIPMTPNQETVETRKDVFVKDLKTVVGDAGGLAKETASAAVEELSQARTRLESGLSEMKDRAVRARDQAAERARGAADATCTYVSENPWKVVAVAALAGLVIGISLSRREGD